MKRHASKTPKIVKELFIFDGLLYVMFWMIFLISACSSPTANPTKIPPEPTLQQVIPEIGSTATNSVPTEVNIMPTPTEEIISIRPLWTVSQYILGPNATWSQKEAEDMLFKPLDIEKTGIIFNGKSCQNVTFQTESVIAADYLKSTYNTTPQALTLTDQDIEVVKTNCDIPGFQEYIRLSDLRLIISLNGVFFFFNPNVNY
jgi:hypothetical protein